MCEIIVLVEGVDAFVDMYDAMHIRFTRSGLLAPTLDNVLIACGHTSEAGTWPGGEPH